MLRVSHAAVVSWQLGLELAERLTGPDIQDSFSTCRSGTLAEMTETAQASLSFQRLLQIASLSFILAWWSKSAGFPRRDYF